jgi:hypothetical protein
VVALKPQEFGQSGGLRRPEAGTPWWH